MTILKEIKELQTGNKELRKFGLTVGGVFLGIAILWWLRHRDYYIWPLIASLFLLLFGIVRPGILRWVYVAWMSIAFTLGFVMSTLLLTLFFYVVLTPVGLLAKCMGRDFLNRKWEPSASTYWIERDSTKKRTRSDYEQQF